MDEFQRIKAHGIPSPLHHIWRHTYLVTGTAVAQVQDDVIGVDTFGFFHAVKPIPHDAVRLSDLLVPVLSRY
jgi:hypothetical protein